MYYNKLCVKAHVLRTMVFIGLFGDATPDVTDIKNLTSEQIKAAIEEFVSEVRQKEPESRVIDAALVVLQMPMKIEDPRMGVRQLVVDYFERMENIGYGSFKIDGPKKTVAHITDALSLRRLQAIVRKDLKYREGLKRDVKKFIKYVEEQAEYVEKSRNFDNVKPDKTNKRTITTRGDSQPGIKVVSVRKKGWAGRGPVGKPRSRSRGKMLQYSYTLSALGKTIIISATTVTVALIIRSARSYSKTTAERKPQGGSKIGQLRPHGRRTEQFSPTGNVFWFCAKDHFCR